MPPSPRLAAQCQTLNLEFAGSKSAGKARKLQVEARLRASQLPNTPMSLQCYTGVYCGLVNRCCVLLAADLEGDNPGALIRSAACWKRRGRRPVGCYARPDVSLLLPVLSCAAHQFGGEEDQQFAQFVIMACADVVQDMPAVLVE